jgi:hypothetical protein
MTDYKFQMSVKNARGDMLNVTGKNKEEFANNWEWAREHFGLPPFMEAGVATSQPVSEGAQKMDGLPSIEVETIELASGGEHPRWVVKGKPFTKFGITCWPETLEAVGILEHLKADGVNTPGKKWRAYYFEKQSKEGKAVPDKVDRLELI